MGPGVAHLVQPMLDALRYLMWIMVSGFAAIGAAFYGGAAVHAVWQKVGQTSSAQQTEADVISREAADGIAEIEAFLSAHGPRPDPPLSDGQRKNIPPSSDERP